MSSAGTNPMDIWQQLRQRISLSYPVWQAELLRYRQQAGEVAQQRTLLFHDWIYLRVRHQDIEQMRWYWRPKARIDNFLLDQLQGVTRPALEYMGNGLGLVLDKTAVQTWLSATPWNISHLVRRPDLVKLYAQQRWLGVQQFSEAIDRQSAVRTVLNLRALWWQRVSRSFEVQRFFWDQRLSSSYSSLRPWRVAQDKAKQLAFAYYDVWTDIAASTVGWFAIGFMAFNLPPTVRRRTQLATELWADRTLVNRLPFVQRGPIKFLLIKPFTKVFYNPWVLAGLVVYKTMSSLGQKIEGYEKLELLDPELFRQLQTRDRSMLQSERWLNMLLALQQRKPGNGGSL